MDSLPLWVGLPAAVTLTGLSIFIVYLSFRDKENDISRFKAHIE